MAHEVHSIDALLMGIPEAQPIVPAKSMTADEKPAPAQNPGQGEPPIETDFADDDAAQALRDREVADKITKQATVEQTSAEVDAQPPVNRDIDEYGNPVAKQKTYTEDEVQRMIRDRLARGATGRAQQEQPFQQPTQQQVQQAQNAGFQYDDNSPDSWQQQLKSFVRNEFQEINKEEVTRQQKAANAKALSDFEVKFQAGMGRYDDFVETVSSKPITNDMMMGIRGLDNPAAFLYTAAKRAPGELERIASLPDPYLQVAEMGRLHERLAKAKTGSNAPKPVTPERGDMTDRAPAKVSIDHLIQQDATKRYSRG